MHYDDSSMLMQCDFWERSECVKKFNEAQINNESNYDLSESYGSSCGIIDCKRIEKGYNSSCFFYISIYFSQHSINFIILQISFSKKVKKHETMVVELWWS